MDFTEYEQSNPTSGRVTLNFYDQHRGSQQSSHSRMVVPQIQNLQSQLSKHEVRREIIAKDFLSKNIHAMSSQNIGLANNRPRSSVPMIHRNFNNMVQVNMNKDLDMDSNADVSETRTHQKRYFKSRLLREQQHGVVDFFAQQCDKMGGSKLKHHQRANSNSLGTFDLQLISQKQSTLNHELEDDNRLGVFKKKSVRVKFQEDNKGGRNARDKQHKSNKLSQQLNDLSQIGKDLRILKKLSKQSKQDMRRIKNTKIVVPRATERQEEISTINSQRQNQSKLQTMSRKNFQQKLYAKPNQHHLNSQSRQSQGCIYDDLEMSEDDQISQQSAKIDIFNQHKNSGMNQLQAVKNGLKALQGDNGFIRPQFAFECLNQIQKDADPKAYQCEMQHALDLKNQRDKQIQEQNNQYRRQEEQKRQEEMQHEKALFDFDEEINELDDIKDRYPVVLKNGQETKVDIPNQQEQETTADPILKKYTVKKTERPALPQNILDDLNRIKQKQQLQKDINQQVIQNDLNKQQLKEQIIQPPKVQYHQEDKQVEFANHYLNQEKEQEMIFKKTTQKMEQSFSKYRDLPNFAPILKKEKSHVVSSRKDTHSSTYQNQMMRPPLSKMPSSTTATLNKDRTSTIFEKKPIYTEKCTPRKEEHQQVRIQTQSHQDARNNSNEMNGHRLSSASLTSQFQKPQLFSQKLLESIKRQYAVQPHHPLHFEKHQSSNQGYYRPKKIKTMDKKMRQKSAVVGQRQSNYQMIQPPQHGRGSSNFINEAIQLSNNYMVPSSSKGRFHFYNIKLDKQQAQFSKFKQQERPIITAQGKRANLMGGTTGYKFNY